MKGTSSKHHCFTRFYSRMRSEGFSFNSWGSGGRALFAIRCFYVRNRPQPSATVRGRALRRCHGGKLLQVTFHGCVTCQFAPLFHCDLHEKDMSRKQRDAFRCTGAAFGEICRLLRSTHKSFLQECPTRVSQMSVPQECPTRVSHKSFLQECPTGVSHKSVPQECPTRVSQKSVPQECPVRVSHKSFLQE